MHHTADASSGPQLEKINAYHQKKFNLQSATGSFVGYHYFIEQDGRVYQTRPDTEEGAHTKGQNFSSSGIALAGNFDYNRPTGGQTLALVKIIDKLIKTYQIPATEIYPHRKFRPTSCYGLQLSDEWARQQYRDFLAANLNHILVILQAILEQLYNYVRFKK